MRKLLELIQEPSGKLSSKRVILFLVILTFLVLWVRASWLSATIADVPSGVHIVILYLLGAKGAERFAENKFPK